MSIIDLVITILLVAGVVFGFFAGFSKKRLGTFASECAFLVAYLAGAPLVALLEKTNLGSLIQSGYVNILPKSEAFVTSISSTDLTLRNTQMSTALSEIHIFKIFQGIFTSHATDFTGTAGDALASSFASWTLIGVTYLVLAIAVYVLIRVIFSPLWSNNGLFGENGRSLVGRICGIVRMLFKTCILIIAVMMVLSLVSSLMVKFDNTALQDWLDVQLKLSDGDAFSIGKMFYKTASGIFDWIALKA